MVALLPQRLKKTSLSLEPKRALYTVLEYIDPVAYIPSHAIPSYTWLMPVLPAGELASKERSVSAHFWIQDMSSLLYGVPCWRRQLSGYLEAGLLRPAEDGIVFWGWWCPTQRIVCRSGQGVIKSFIAEQMALIGSQ
ncbi:hypothetical protein VTJ04DRAFT_2073 [Mycothermus thermophilus]|uniref:uncharacterized protein n=1 Tax=Humicola insolens TaxID=85995 RepID=UPI003741F21F